MNTTDFDDPLNVSSSTMLRFTFVVYIEISGRIGSFGWIAMKFDSHIHAP